MAAHNALPGSVLVEMQARLDGGVSARTVARENGYGHTTVFRLLKQGRLKAPIAEAASTLRKRGRQPVCFPKWIDRDYYPDYHANLTLYGEETAARLARAAMAEARKAEV